MYKFIIITLLLTFSCLNQAQNIDPTKPLTASVSSQSSDVVVKKGLTLETIIYSENSQSAIINGKLMKLGDYIDNKELIVVNASSVVLRSDDERIKLSMFSSVITK